MSEVQVERRTFETHSPAETEALGASFASTLKTPALILLSGELGAGKTAFVRGMAQGLNVPPEQRVTSPTYILLHVYKGGRATLYHIDAYRLGGGADEFEASGLNECFDDQNGVVCIEWPEKAGGMNWSDERFLIEIEHVDPTVRTLVFNAFGSRNQEVCRQLESHG